MPGPVPKRRSKTYTGCWTCRARHLKCDEGRPECVRCKNSNINCEGYQIRLNWDNSRVLTKHRYPAANQRAYAFYAGNSAPRHCSPNNHVELSENEGTSPHHQLKTSERLLDIDLNADDTTQDGLNTVDEVEQRPLGEDDKSPTMRTSDVPRAASATFFATTSPSQRCDPSRGVIGSQISQHRRRTFSKDYAEHVSSASLLALADTALHVAPSPSVTDASSSVTTSHEPEDDGCTPQTGSCSSSTGSEQRFAGHPDESRAITHLELLPTIPLQRTILEYWSTDFCDTILPVPSLRNPLRDIIMPIALQGARTASRSSSAAVAVFHLICSSSAHQLSRIRATTANRETYATIALTHHNLGLVHLRQNLMSYHQDQHVAVLAALFMCILNESITVSNPAWRAHIHGSIQWLRRIGPELWTQSEAGCILYQLFAGHAILSLSPFLHDGSCDSGSSTIDFQCSREQYCLDQIYGVPYDMLNAVNKLNKIMTGAIHLSENDLDLLEMEMYLMVPSKTMLNSYNGEDNNASYNNDNNTDGFPTAVYTSRIQELRLSYHLNYTFYFASLIYFKRSIRHVPVASVQHLVVKAITHLEAACQYASGPFSPTVWSSAIPAFEIDDQALLSRWLRMCENFWAKTNFEVWDTLKVLAMRLWEERNVIGQENMTWQTLMKMEPDLSMMLI